MDRIVGGAGLVALAMLALICLADRIPHMPWSRPRRRR
jgi:hypothetical protein